MVSARPLNGQLPVLFLTGSTASGKTQLAIQLADRLAVDLVNVDAAQVYRGMDIGTAKLSKQQQRAYPHQLIDIRDPSDPYDAAQFRRDALQIIKTSHRNGRVPLLVGGSLFYFSALENGVSKLPAADAAMRATIAAQAEALGWPALFAQLQAADPECAARINPADQQRVGRALEIHRLTGLKPSVAMAQAQPEKLNLPLLKFNLSHPDRAILHQTIARRFQQMLDQGLIDEVAHLKKRADLHPKLAALRCVGYRQVWAFLNGEYDEQTMIAKSCAATRQLAKRQLTWLRNQSGQIWLDATYKHNAAIIENFYRAQVPAGSGF